MVWGIGGCGNLNCSYKAFRGQVLRNYYISKCYSEPPLDGYRNGHYYGDFFDGNINPRKPSNIVCETIIRFVAGIAQLVRAQDCGSWGRGFETHYPPSSFQIQFPASHHSRAFITSSTCYLSFRHCARNLYWSKNGTSKPLLERHWLHFRVGWSEAPAPVWDWPFECRFFGRRLMQI